MTNDTRIIKAAADFLSAIARVARMSKENCQVADNHAQELYSLLVRPEPKQEPVAFDIDEYQQKRYDNGQPEDPTAYPDWKPDSECTQEPVGYIRKSAIKALKDTDTAGFEGVHTMVSRYPNKYNTEPLYTAPALVHQPVTAGLEKYRDNYVCGEGYEMGLWSRRNIEAFFEDQDAALKSGSSQ